MSKTAIGIALFGAAAIAIYLLRKKQAAAAYQRARELDTGLRMDPADYDRPFVTAAQIGGSTPELRRITGGFTWT